MIITIVRTLLDASVALICKEYKPKLRDYYQRALQKGGHTPHLIEEALSWHKKYLETGSMK